MATSLTTFQQPVFLSEADRKRLEDMEAQRLSYNTALETYNAKLAEMEAQRLAYNRDLEAYKATFVPGANAGEVALVQRINGQLYDAAGNILPPDTQYSSQAGLPENVFVRRTGGKLGEADAAAMSRYQQALNTYNQQLAQYKDYSSSFLLGKDYQPVKVKDFTQGRLPAAQKYYSIAGPTGSVADVLNAPAGATPSFFMKEPGVPRGYAPGDMFEFVQTGTEPDPYGISRTGDPVGYLRVRRDGGFTSADPSSFAVRTAPTEPVMPQAQYVFPSQPTLPYKETDIPTAPKQPFTEAEFTQAQEESQERAKQAAGQRAVALQAFEDPSRFGLSGFSALSGRSFAKGGEVKEEDPKTKSGKMMKELGFSKPPKERTLADEPSRQSPESLAYSLRAQAEGNKDRDLRRKTLSAPGALEVKRFEEGGEARSKDRDDVSREIFEDVTFFKQSQPLPGQPEHERVRSDTLGFIKRMDDRSVMVAASKMSGMPVESPTQARVMLEKMLGPSAVSFGVMGSGKVLPERLTGYSLGARTPLAGGEFRAGVDVPRGVGKPMFNVGYAKEFQKGGPVSKGRRPVREAPPRAPQASKLDSGYTFGSEDAFEFTPVGTRNRMTRFIKSAAGDASNPAAKSLADPQITRSREEFDRLAKASKQPPMPSDVSGMFDAFVGPRGAIFVSPLGGPSTYSHEMTHAADYNMGKLYRQAIESKERKSNPAAQQFVDAYEKLVGKGPAQESRAEGARRLAPEWFDRLERQQAYRNYPPELAAFAMENAIGGDRGQLTPQTAPLHVDPTLATEFTILTDLAQKYVDSRTNKPR